MSKKCQVTGKGPNFGHKVSHSNRKSPKKQSPNVQKRRFWSPERREWLTLKVSTRAIRTIDKIGVDKVLAMMQLSKKSAA